MCRYLRPSAVNGPVWLGVYTKAMMNNRILTICAAMAAAMVGTSLAHAQQGYPSSQGYPSQGSVYSASPGPYLPGGYAVEERRGIGVPDFDALEDDEAPNAQSSTALPPPGPVLSPDDPRYGRPAGAPVYSDRGATMPTGPILSPDDPRYGRPAGPPPVIYADRPPGSQQPAYSDRVPPGAGMVYPNDDRALRPPGAVGGAPAVTGTVQPQQAPVGADGRPVQMSALPPEEQPEVAPVQLPPNLRRQEVAFVTKEPPGTLVVDTPNTYLYYVLGGGRAIRYGARPSIAFTAPTSPRRSASSSPRVVSGC
jgi:hypothetical protein